MLGNKVQKNLKENRMKDKETNGKEKKNLREDKSKNSILQII